MSPFMIGLSLFATLMSTLSYLALPGEMIAKGPLIFSEFISYPLIFLIVGWLLIPWIMRLKVTSGYELLEARLGITGRLLGSGMFVVLRVIWMASIFYATADKVLIPLLDLKDPRKVIARGKEWIMAPRESYERVGDVPNVVFVTAAIPDYDRDEVRLYYGGADTVFCMASAKISELIEFAKTR